MEDIKEKTPAAATELTAMAATAEPSELVEAPPTLVRKEDIGEQNTSEDAAAPQGRAGCRVAHG